MSREEGLRFLVLALLVLFGRAASAVGQERPGHPELRPPRSPALSKSARVSAAKRATVPGRNTWMRTSCPTAMRFSRPAVGCRTRERARTATETRTSSISRSCGPRSRIQGQRRPTGIEDRASPLSPPIPIVIGIDGDGEEPSQTTGEGRAHEGFNTPGAPVVILL